MHEAKNENQENHLMGGVDSFIYSVLNAGVCKFADGCILFLSGNILSRFPAGDNSGISEQGEIRAGRSDADYR